MDLIIAGTIFLAAALAALALYWWLEARRETLPQRFKELVGDTVEVGGDAIDAPQRWIGKIRDRFKTNPPREAEIVEMFSGKALSGSRLLLNNAGYRSARSYTAYIAIRLALPAVGVALAFAYGKFAGTSPRLLSLVIIAIAIAGVLLPDMLLRVKIRKRQESLIDALPDGLDLLVVCVEAGLGLNAAFVKITEEFRLSSPELSEEFDVVNREMVAGKPRQEALRALADRTGVEDLKSLVAMLIQTEKLGTSLAQSLRVHSDSLRTKRRQRAEERAAKTAIKMLFPLVFFLFPALFIVILGPGAIQIFHALLSKAAK
ncbi:MAG: Bacterial type secretion system protein domain protein [Deltaproteobacteria bacterium]|nr:Bacterial type secretion system protein domain protein [Deltaproteobacteria bacterium]